MGLERPCPRAAIDAAERYAITRGRHPARERRPGPRYVVMSSRRAQQRERDRAHASWRCRGGRSDIIAMARFAHRSSKRRCSSIDAQLVLSDCRRPGRYRPWPNASPRPFRGACRNPDGDELRRPRWTCPGVIADRTATALDVPEASAMPTSLNQRNPGFTKRSRPRALRGAGICRSVRMSTTARRYSSLPTSSFVSTMQRIMPSWWDGGARRLAAGDLHQARVAPTRAALLVQGGTVSVLWL